MNHLVIFEHLQVSVFALLLSTTSMSSEAPRLAVVVVDDVLRMVTCQGRAVVSNVESDKYQKITSSEKSSDPTQIELLSVRQKLKEKLIGTNRLERNY